MGKIEPYHRLNKKSLVESATSGLLGRKPEQFKGVGIYALVNIGSLEHYPFRPPWGDISPTIMIRVSCHQIFVLETSTFGRVNFASAQNNVAVIRKLTLKNNTRESLDDLTITLSANPPVIREKNMED